MAGTDPLNMVFIVTFRANQFFFAEIYFCHKFHTSWYTLIDTQHLQLQLDKITDGTKVTHDYSPQQQVKLKINVFN